jgi:hypothetical protein
LLAKFYLKKQQQNYGPFVVEVLNYQQYPAMTSHMVKIQKRTAEESSERKPTALEHLMGKKPVYRRPTLSGFLSPEIEEERKEKEIQRNRTCPPGQSFRFKSIYRGKFRSQSERNADGGYDVRRISSATSSVSQAIRQGGAKVVRVVRSASQMARRIATRRNPTAERKFTAPSSATLEHFDKVLFQSKKYKMNAVNFFYAFLVFFAP